MSKPKNVAIVSVLILSILTIAVCLIIQELQDNNINLLNNDSNNSQNTINQFESNKGVIVKLDSLKSGDTISSPFTITGKIPGNWSFEATFPVSLVNWDGLIIAEGSAVLLGDWMTEKDVSFTATLAFESPTINKNGTIIFQKSNPSGLPENDDTIEIPIKFQ